MNSALVRILFAVALLCTPSAAQLAWTRLPPTAPALTDSGHAYDTGRGRLVVFGGARNGVPVAETWEWDGAVWTQLAPADAPSPRVRPAMVYDAARSRVLLFGGMDGLGGFEDDTWVFDGTTWRQVGVAVRPSPRAGAAMAYDTELDRAVLFGGFDASGQDADDTWAFDHRGWNPLLAVNRPPARGAHRLAFDAVRGEVVLHGGYRTALGSTVGDTWTYDGFLSWHDRSSVSGPGSVRDPVLAWDAARQRVVCYGGAHVVGTTVTARGGLHDWDGNGWTARPTTGAGPGTRSFAYGDYVPARARIELAAGQRAGVALNDAWALAPVHPARITSIGTGCAGGSTRPRLVAAPGEGPWLGSSFELRVVDAPTGIGMASLAVGLSATQWGAFALPLDLAGFGAPGCTLGTSIEFTAPVALTQGTGVFRGTVCNCPSVLGATFYMQAMVPDRSVARPLAIAITDAVEAVVGAR